MPKVLKITHEALLQKPTTPNPKHLNDKKCKKIERNLAAEVRGAIAQRTSRAFGTEIEGEKQAIKPTFLLLSDSLVYGWLAISDFSSSFQSLS